jgi:heme exporter protein CcmD
VKDYTAYIVAAYGLAALVIGFLTVKITLDYRALQKKLAHFGDQEKAQ